MGGGVKAAAWRRRHQRHGENRVAAAWRRHKMRIALLRASRRRCENINVTSSGGGIAASIRTARHQRQRHRQTSGGGGGNRHRHGTASRHGGEVAARGVIA